MGETQKKTKKTKKSFSCITLGMTPPLHLPLQTNPFKPRRVYPVGGCFSHSFGVRAERPALLPPAPPHTRSLAFWHSSTRGGSGEVSQKCLAIYDWRKRRCQTCRFKHLKEFLVHKYAEFIHSYLYTVNIYTYVNT